MRRGQRREKGKYYGQRGENGGEGERELRSGRGGQKNVRLENKRRRGETEKLGEGRGEKIGMARMEKGKGGERGEGARTAG